MTDVLIAPDSLDASETTTNTFVYRTDVHNVVDKRVLEAERLLDDLLAESAQLAPSSVNPNEDKATTQESSDSRSFSSSLAVMRPKTDKKNDVVDAKLPTWLMEEKKTTAQVELLIPQARKMLNEVIPNDTEGAVNFGQAVHQAVMLASESLRHQARFSRKDLEIAEQELQSLLLGKGPLQSLYDDNSVTDIFIDHHKSIKVVRHGQAIETPFCFRSAEEYRLFITAMLQSVDRTLNMSSPIVDCVLVDSWRSRVNAIDASVIEGDEPRVAIRIPRLQQISFYDVLQSRTLPATLAAWLTEVVACGQINILVVGATGSGKTVMTTALLSAVGSDERIITIEDVPEIFVPTPHLEKLVSRPPNAQGEGEITMPELLRAALRRAPHRIVVGEIRDEEGRLFLRALETGHAGSIATLHADTARDGLWRLLDLVSAYEKSPQDSIMRRIARSVHLIITMRKIGGRPCMVSVEEVVGVSNGEFDVCPLVGYVGERENKRHWQVMTENSMQFEHMQKRGVPLLSGPCLLPFSAQFDTTQSNMTQPKSTQSSVTFVAKRSELNK